MDYSFSNGSVKLLGRAFEYMGLVGLSYSASGIEFEAEGGCEIGIVADRVSEFADADIHYARYLLFVDNTRCIDERLTEQEKTLKIELDGRHTYRLVKASESRDSSIFVKSVRALEGEILATAPKQNRIEFIGDSITCGYGVDGRLAIDEFYTTATEDATKAYAYLTAETLDYDYSIVSTSGAGIISGYTADGKRNTDNIFIGNYDCAGCSMTKFADGISPYDISYDFSFRPNIVVVNLGTNDKSYLLPDCGITEENTEGAEKEMTREQVLEYRAEFFRNEYIKFLKHIREMNPDSFIICSIGIMEDAINGEVFRAAEDYTAMTGDERVGCFEFRRLNIEKEGIGTDWHPSPITQSNSAEALCNYINSLKAEGKV